MGGPFAGWCVRSRHGLKLSTTVVQISGFTHSVAVLGPKQMLTGLVRLTNHPNVTESVNRGAAFVMTESPFMQQRATTMHRDMFDAVRMMQRAGKLRGVAGKAFFWPIVKMQLMVDVPTWLGAYDQGLRMGKAHQDAVSYADSIVVRAQGSA